MPLRPVGSAQVRVGAVGPIVGSSQPRQWSGLRYVAPADAEARALTPLGTAIFVIAPMTSGALNCAICAATELGDMSAGSSVKPVSESSLTYMPAGGLRTKSIHVRLTDSFRFPVR